MVEKPSKPSKQRRGLSGFLQTWFRQVRRYLITGLLVWVPLIITAWVCWIVLYRVGFGLEGLIQRVMYALNLYYYPGAGFLIALGIFLATGFLTRYYVGRRLINLGEHLLERIPLISRVYSAVVQIRDVFVGRQGGVFQHVCLVEYPRAGMIAIGFVTASELDRVHQVLGARLLAVFVPTTPNPTSGYLVYLPPEEVIDICICNAMVKAEKKGAPFAQRNRAGAFGSGPAS